MHTQNIKIAYAVETNYACGNNSVSTTKYACNAFADTEVADLTAMNAPYSSGPSLGLPKVNRKKIRPVGRGANYAKSLDVGYEYGEFTYTQAIQNQTWIQAAIQAAAGAIPTSYVFHLEIPGVDGVMDYFDLCGCVLQKYEVDMGEDDWPTETLTFLYYDLVDGVAITDAADALVPTDAQPSTKRDMAFTMDGDAMTDLATLKLTIENTLIDAMVASKHLRQDPSLKFRDITGEAEFTTDAAAIMGDSLARNGALTAINTIPLILSLNNASNTLTLTEMYCKTDSLGEIPDTTENIIFKTEFEQGGDCALTYA